MEAENQPTAGKPLWDGRHAKMKPNHKKEKDKSRRKIRREQRQK